MKKLFFKFKKELNVDELFDRDALAFAGDNNFVNSQAEEAVRVKIERDYQLKSNPAETVVLFQDKSVFNDFNAQDLIDLQVKYWKKGQEQIAQYKNSQIFYDYGCLEVPNKKEENRIRKEIEKREDFVSWVTYPEEQYDPSRIYYNVTDEYFKDNILVNSAQFYAGANDRNILSFKNTKKNKERYKEIIEKYNLKQITNMSGFLILDKAYSDNIEVHQYRLTEEYVKDKIAQDLAWKKENVERKKQEEEYLRMKPLKDAQEKQQILHTFQKLLSVSITEANVEEYNNLFDRFILLPIQKFTKYPIQLEISSNKPTISDSTNPLDFKIRKDDIAGVKTMLEHFENKK
jgi:hypothetical protein